MKSILDRIIFYMTTRFPVLINRKTVLKEIGEITYELDLTKNDIIGLIEKMRGLDILLKPEN